MGLIRSGEHMAGELRKPQGAFTGDADQRTFHAETRPLPVRVSFVRFQPGSITHWHSHEGGQVLHVVEGEGRAQNRGEAVVELRAGDTLSAGAGQVHWHGATSAAPMAHLVVTIGEVTWLEPPQPET